MLWEEVWENIDWMFNLICYIYVKDKSYVDECELCILFLVIGMGYFVLVDGMKMEFVFGFEFGFDY